jgi:hypothetical protein
VKTGRERSCWRSARLCVAEDAWLVSIGTGQRRHGEDAATRHALRARNAKCGRTSARGDRTRSWSDLVRSLSTA